jgi:hypothetical protein
MKRLIDTEGVVHSEGADGTDFTLCGLAPEGGEGDGPVTMPETRKRIDCQSCLGIIRFCKRIRLPREGSV